MRGELGSVEIMAQVAVTGAPAPSAPQRVTSAGTVVATDSFQNVQATTGNTEISLGNAEFSYDQPQREYKFAFENKNNQERATQHRWSLVRTPTETFARILESFVSGLDGPGSGNGASQTFYGSLARAISIYETNAKVIHGDLAVVGGTISLRL